EVLSSDDISIHPNPVSGNANIEFSLNNTATVNIAVFDILGKQIQNLHEGELSGGSHNIQLNSDNMRQGIYFVKIQMNNEVVTKKIMVN
ncbi:MAG: T9SS type A sorting domain-containing protein, partial [Bacteroidetes bacterium]|nr:T9SS type A sorting domain-containing protein [Bacteroidota bacterium]